MDNIIINLRLRLARRKLDKASCAIAASVQSTNINRLTLVDIAKEYICEAREIIKEIEKNGTAGNNRHDTEWG